MKILLTHGYFLNDDPKEKIIMKPYAPLGILYVSAYLERKGFSNEVFDTTFSNMQKMRDYLLEFKPDVIAIYVNLMTKLNVLEIIKFIKLNLHHTKIVLGGPEIRYNANDFLNFGADYLVIGEGEETSLELMIALNEKRIDDIKNIPGLGFKNQNNEIVFTTEREKLKEVDSLPFPGRDKINLQLYLNAWKERHGENAISISTMRGCPYTCKWCSRAVYGLSYRRRSPENVCDELELIQKEYNPDTLWFVDDVFTISHKWLNEFNETLKQRNLKIKFECITRADRMNEEVIKLLKDAGCFRVWIGAESGSQKVIDLMDRRVDVDQVREMIKLAQKYKIQAGTFIMLGYPGETEDDIEETIKHLKESNPEYFTITVAYPIKGTELFAEVEAVQTNNFNWDSNSDRDREFKRTYNRKYYDFAVRRVTNEVNYNKMILNNKYLSKSTLVYKTKSFAAKLGMLYYRIAGN
ncbi:MAG: B12-binding domain-containing radical SAM protein [Ignavibacteriales bacterium]|nr:B12-binding domain-containing radical SAM protein [Ignavibacteriales bacterium]